MSVRVYIYEIALILLSGFDLAGFKEMSRLLPPRLIDMCCVCCINGSIGSPLLRLARLVSPFLIRYAYRFFGSFSSWYEGSPSVFNTPLYSSWPS